MDAEDRAPKRKRPAYVRNDRHNHLDASGHLAIDWRKLAVDAAAQADREDDAHGADTRG